MNILYLITIILPVFHIHFLCGFSLCHVSVEASIFHFEYTYKFACGHVTDHVARSSFFHNHIDSGHFNSVSTHALNLDMDLERILAVGQKLELTGEELKIFVEKQQNLEEKKLQEEYAREEKKRQEEYAREEKKRQEALEREERLLAREERKQREDFELRKRELEIEEKKLEKLSEKGEGSVRNNPKTPKLPPFHEKEDIDAYLSRFERYAEAAHWKKSDWAINLSALLTGKALETYFRMSATDIDDYEKIKSTLLRRFELTEHEFRKRFYTSTAEKGETSEEFCTRLESYLKRWIELSGTSKTYEGLRDLLVQEHFITACDSRIAVFLRERKFENLHELQNIADNFVTAHNMTSLSHDTSSKMNTSGKQLTCHRCGKSGHIASKCRVALPENKAQIRSSYSTDTKNLRKCYICHRVGHIARDCKNDKPMRHTTAGIDCEEEEGECDLQREHMKDVETSRNCPCHASHPICFISCLGEVEDDLMPKGDEYNVCQLTCKEPVPACFCKNIPTVSGFLNGDEVQVMRDTGCDGVVVKESHVKPHQYTGKYGWCRLINGYVMKVPMADVEIDSPYYVGTTRAMVLKTPVYSLILGNIEGVRDVKDPNKDWKPEHRNLNIKEGEFDIPQDTDESLKDDTEEVGQFACQMHATSLPTSKLITAQGKVNGIETTTMRDNGCTSVVVKGELVSKEQYTGRKKQCRLIDGTIRIFPTAVIQVDCPFFVGNVEAVIMPEPIFDLIIGNVVGARNAVNPEEEIHAVLTRQQSKIKDTKTTKPLVVPEQCDIKPTKLKELKLEQEKDASLERIFQKVKEKEEPRVTKASMTWFEIDKGVLYRRHKQLNHPQDPVLKQIVVPRERRPMILKVAHETIMAGHMGIQKTLDRILSNFYWPGIHNDVTRYCRSCDICQRTTPKGKIQKATLDQMPMIDIPFRRVAVDLIGPIQPRSKQGNKYILTVVDYATRYPEAKALANIDTESVAEALIEIFSRIGFPRELLSDQGTQFTSDVMRAVSRLVSIRQLFTTPYHPICNGLVEKMNGTLKTILKRLCAERPEDWDRYLPATLFAYREVPQDSLGFSPFEMIYGHEVRGPMDVIKTLWTEEVDDPVVETSYTYVTNLKERLEQTCKIAQEELSKSSLRYKKYYDRKARNRRLIPGQQALLLLPTDNNKLLMQWKGPFKVLEKLNKHNYRLDINGKVRTFHINMLKEYFTRAEEDTATCMAEEDSIFEAVCLSVVEEDNEDELLDIRTCKGKETYKDVQYGRNLTPCQRQQAEHLVKEFKDIFSDRPGTTNAAEHSIKLTSDEPIRLKPYPLPLSMREVVMKEVQDMLDMDIIEHTNSPYSSPIVLVKKSDGSNRFCIDFRRINNITVFDNEPMPNTEEIYPKLHGDQFISKIDLAKGYWQIPVCEEDKPKTAFVTPDGSFQFKKMPFGLVNSGATFNRMIRKVLKGVKHTDKFVDDLLGHTVTWEEQMQTLRQVFERLRLYHLTARPSKCLIGFQNLEYVGHLVGENVIQPKPQKVAEILDVPQPKTKKQVRSYLGMVGYYRQFIPRFASIALPLTDLTRKGQPNVVEWNEPQELAFQTLKRAITNHPILKIPDLKEPFILQTDASEQGLGAAILQEVDGVRHPIAYASKKLLPREKNYSTVEKECLALVWGLKKFFVLLYGREFIVETDHQSLAYINSAKLTNSRVMRWAMYLQNFRFRIRYVQGKDNVIADYLSRAYSSVE